MTGAQMTLMMATTAVATLPIQTSWLSFESGLNDLQQSMVKSVADELNTAARLDIRADSMAATIRPRRPLGNKFDTIKGNAELEFSPLGPMMSGNSTREMIPGRTMKKVGVILSSPARMLPNRP